MDSLDGLREQLARYMRNTVSDPDPVMREAWATLASRTSTMLHCCEAMQSARQYYVSSLTAYVELKSNKLVKGGN